MTTPDMVERILDVLAPRTDRSTEPDGTYWGDKLAELEGRQPIFEWGHEGTPTLAELRELAEKIAAAVR